MAPFRTRTPAISTISHPSTFLSVVSRSNATKSRNASGISRLCASCSALNVVSPGPRWPIWPGSSTRSPGATSTPASRKPTLVTPPPRSIPASAISTPPSRLSHTRRRPCIAVASSAARARTPASAAGSLSSSCRSSSSVRYSPTRCASSSSTSPLMVVCFRAQRVQVVERQLEAPELLGLRILLLAAPRRQAGANRGTRRGPSPPRCGSAGTASPAARPARSDSSGTGSPGAEMTRSAATRYCTTGSSCRARPAASRQGTPACSSIPSMRDPTSCVRYSTPILAPWQPGLAPVPDDVLEEPRRLGVVLVEDLHLHAVRRLTGGAQGLLEQAWD